jgi:hypothetical protein
VGLSTSVTKTTSTVYRLFLHKRLCTQDANFFTALYNVSSCANRGRFAAISPHCLTSRSYAWGKGVVSSERASEGRHLLFTKHAVPLFNHAHRPSPKIQQKDSCPSSGPYCRHITTAENQHVTLVLRGIELATPAEIQVESSLELS